MPETPFPSPGSRALRRGRETVPGARYLITKNTHRAYSSLLNKGNVSEIIINWFFTAAARKWFELTAFVVMPDHYHLVFTLGEVDSLSRVIGKINENTAKLIKRSLDLREGFWQPGYHDHRLWPEEDVNRYIEYAHMNPVEEKLVKKPEDWPWSSAHPDYARRLGMKR
jgi:putative transposase